MSSSSWILGLFFIVPSISNCEMRNMRSLATLKGFHEKTLFFVIKCLNFGKSNETFFEEMSQCFSFEVHILAGDIIIKSFCGDLFIEVSGVFSCSLVFPCPCFLHELCNELNCPLARLKSPVVKQSLFFHIVLHWKLCAKETVCFLQLICDWGICRIFKFTLGCNQIRLIDILE